MWFGFFSWEILLVLLFGGLWNVRFMGIEFYIIEYSSRDLFYNEGGIGVDLWLDYILYYLEVVGYKDYWNGRLRV